MVVYDTVKIAKEAKEIVLIKVTEYNQRLNQFSSNSIKIAIYWTIIMTMSLTIFTLRLIDNPIILTCASITIATLFFLLCIFFDNDYTSSENICIKTIQAAFFGYLRGAKPINLKPLIDKEELWTDLVSRLPSQSSEPNEDIIFELVINTVRALRARSIELYYANQQ